MTADYPTMTTAEIRSAYLSFFEERGNKLYPSSSLVPMMIPPCCSPMLA